MGSDNEESSSSSKPAELLDQFRNLDVVNYIGVNDFADELSYKWTSCLLTAFCTLVTMKTYFMEPVACFMPTAMGFAIENQNQYVNSYCWTEGTYAVHPVNFSLHAHLRDGGVSRYADAKIIYYQWVPIVLGIQAVLFYLPRLIWHGASYDRAGTDVGHLVRVANDASREKGEQREKMVNHAARMLYQMLKRNYAVKSIRAPEAVQSALRKAWRALSVAMPAHVTGSWLILTYLFIKLAYLANVLLQLGLMRHFLGIESSRYDMLGATLLWDVAHGLDWQVTGIFPRVGCCAVLFRTAAGGNWMFAQCTLSVNMINEKIYIFLWFWFVFVTGATILSLLAWLWRVCRTSCGNHFVNRMLKLADNYAEAKSNEYVRRFCHIFLRRDGTFVLKMIALNCGDIVCSEVVQRVWTLYRRDKHLEHSECNLTGVLKLQCSNDCPEQLADHKGLRRRRRRASASAAVDRQPAAAAEDAFQNATAPPPPPSATAGNEAATDGGSNEVFLPLV